MDLMHLILEQEEALVDLASIFLTLMIFLNTFLNQINSIMTMMQIFLVLSSEEKEVKEVKEETVLASVLVLQCSIMMILWKGSEEVDSPNLNHLHLAEMDLEVHPNLLAQSQKQCNLFIYGRNGKTVTIKKTTVVNSDGSKEVT